MSALLDYCRPFRLCKVQRDISLNLILLEYFWIRCPFKTHWDEVARRGSQQELMDNQLIVSPQSEHGLGSEKQESTHTQAWVEILFGLQQSLCHMPSLNGPTQGKSLFLEN